MTAKNTKKGSSLSSLRKKAGAKLRKQDESVQKLSAKNIRDLAHELGTHQIELEMQNEELRRAQEEIEASRSRYADLYDFAPVGYFTLDENGLIIEVNLTGAEMLGINRRFLLKKSFTAFIQRRADHDIFHIHRREVLGTQDRHTCEIVLRRKDDSSFSGQLISRPVEGKAGHTMTAVIDITQRKKAEEAMQRAYAEMEQRVEERTRELSKTNESLLNEIAERKRAEEALRESEEQFRTLAESIPNLAWWANGDGYITWYNRRWYEYTGTTPQQMEGWGWQSVHDPKVLPRVLDRWKASIATGEPFDMEFPLRGADGLFRPFLTRVLPLKGSTGQVLKWFGTNTDISAIKQVEEALRATSERYRSYIDVTGQLGWTTNADGEVVEDMPSWRKFTGQTYDELRGMGWSKALHPDDRAQVSHAWGKAVADRNKYEIEYRIRRHDGIYRYFMARGIPVFNEEGSIREWVGTCIDITERKQAEEALRESEEKYRTLFASVKEGFTLNRVLYDDKGKLYDLMVFEANPAAAKANSLKREDFLGKTWRELWPGAEEYWWDICNKVMLTGEDIRYENYAKVQDRWYEVHHFKAGNDLMGSIFSDISERKKAEESLKTAHTELERRAYELEAVNRELEAFSYTVSHDLKAPLRSIDGFARALLEDYADKLDATGRDYLVRVNAAALRMNQLIDAMLNMARLTRGELHEKTVDLSSLARVVARNLQKRDPERQVEFTIAQEVKAKGDQDMLMIVLQNLLDNSWKFTSKHPIAKIDFGVANRDGKTVYFVRDDGAGFDMQYAEELFMPFIRYHRESEFPGLGIGLAIAHRIIVRHGGKMWAESVPEKGTMIFFTLG
ncbi:MAG: PAS domain S-box protein [Betaproteobacteria bacterium]